MYEVEGGTQEEFDREPESGVDPDGPSLVLNIIVNHSVDNPMANNAA